MLEICSGITKTVLVMIWAPLLHKFEGWGTTITEHSGPHATQSPATLCARLLSNRQSPGQAQRQMADYLNPITLNPTPEIGLSAARLPQPDGAGPLRFCWGCWNHFSRHTGKESCFIRSLMSEFGILGLGLRV